MKRPADPPLETASGVARVGYVVHLAQVAVEAVLPVPHPRETFSSAVETGF